MKRIIICADGTWNKPDQSDGLVICNPSNVVKITRAIPPLASNNKTHQVVFYDQGVGTEWTLTDKLWGGAIGIGLDKNIKDCYRFLVHNYEEGDEIFLFGFSRGAYTVRSLAGMIERSRLLTKEDADFIPEAFAFYRKDKDGYSKKEFEAIEQGFWDGTHHERRKAPCREVNIKFMGVWDTVGAYGIPGALNWKILKNHQFHNVQLGKIVKHAYHALSIDEKRNPFEPTLWELQEVAVEDQILEQVWFAGAHEDVGGGLDNDGLSNCSIQWMIEKAEACGLEFDRSYTCQFEPDPKDELHDFYFSIFWILGRHNRTIGQKDNEYIHETALKRMKGRAPKWKDGGPYKPKNLIKYLEDKDNEVKVVRTTTYQNCKSYKERGKEKLLLVEVK